MNKWFKFQLNKNKMIAINMDRIEVLEFTLNSVTIPSTCAGDFELTGDDAERFRREFERYNSWQEGIIRVERAR